VSGSGGTSGSGGVVAGRGGSAGGSGGSAGGDGGVDATAADGGAVTPLVWRPVTVSGLDTELGVSAIGGGGASDLYLGTRKGTVFRRTPGGTWTKAAVSTRRIEWIWVSAAGDAYASDGDRSGSAQKLYHSNGGDVWTPVALPADYDIIRGIWGPSPDEVFVASGIWSTGVGAVLHLKNGTWTAETTGQHLLNRVWGSSATDVYAIGSDGETLYHSTGNGTWLNQPVGYGRWMTALWGSGPGDVFVAMSPANVSQGQAFIGHSRASGGWALEHGLVDEIVTIWGSGPRDVYAGGRKLAEPINNSRTAFYHSTGDGQWTPVTLPDAIGTGGMVYVVWGVSATEVYVGGFSTSVTAVLLQGSAR
jgi:hypothetical protein